MDCRARALRLDAYNTGHLCCLCKPVRTGVNMPREAHMENGDQLTVSDSNWGKFERETVEIDRDVPPELQAGATLAP